MNLATQAGMFAGGGADTIPLSLNPTIWLDSADASTLYDATTGGSNVSLTGDIKRWEDKSGNGYHAIQSTGANCPTRETGGVSFNGSTDWMEMDYSVSFTAISVFVVWRSPDTTNGRLIDQRGTGALSTVVGWYIKHRNLTSDITLIDDGAGSAITDDPDAVFTHSVYHTTTMLANATTLKTYIDGVELTLERTFGGSVNFATTKAIVLGSNVNGKTTQFFQGFMREVLVFPTLLSAGDASDVEDYLTAKYSL